jgi:hypothetical protein
MPLPLDLIKSFTKKGHHWFHGYQLGQPFSSGRYSYATCGRVLLQFPRHKEIAEATGSQLDVVKGALKLLKDFPKHGFIKIEIPPLTSVRTNADGFQIAKVGEANFNMDFLIKMDRLPNLKVVPRKGSMEAMPFTFDGGRGLVMPTTANARFTINTNRKETQHGPPKEKAGRGAGVKTAAVPRRR